MLIWKTTTLAASIVAASLALAATTVAAGELGMRHHRNPGPFPPGVGSHHHGHGGGHWMGGSFWGPDSIEFGLADGYSDCEMLRQRAVDDFGNVYLRRVRVCG